MKLIATLGFGLACLEIGAAHAGTIDGRVIDIARAPVAGVTVVASRGALQQTAITADDGTYALDVPPGDYLLTYYFGEVVVERRGIHVTDERAVTVNQRLPSPWVEDDDAPPPPPPVPAWTATAPLLARRDHLGLAALDPRVRPGTTATTVAGALRLPGAPPIVGEFVDRLAVLPGPADAALPGASGGTLDATLAARPARMAGLLALELGPDARFVALHTAAIDHGHSWWSSGVALARTGAADGREGAHQAQLMTTIGGDDEPTGGGQVSLLGTWLGDGGRDLWGDAQGTLRADDGRREVTFGITGETLTPPAGDAAGRATGASTPAAVDRVAGRLALTRRWRGAGGHATRIGGEVGMGRADAAEHGDVRAYLDDTWRPTASWRIAAAVRWDRRELGIARADAVLPRLVVAWEPTRDDALTVFAAAERVARLDEVQLGAWRDGAAPGFDRAAVGASRALGDDVQLEVALRGRRATVAGAPTERGVDGALRWLPHGGFAGELAGSTLEGVATARASYACTRGARTLGVAAVGRVDRAGHGWGAAAQWARRVGERSGRLRGALELFDLDDPHARSGRLTLAADW
ncbi:MAG: TonB-dependent receptor [Myxococcales bacterium]|nr:TonB-dependent receptor [Myxococcales bacterium]